MAKHFGGSSMAWEESIRNMRRAFHELEGKKTNLRHNLTHLNPTDLANQYYCEMGVELKHLHGEIQKEEERIGSFLHQELSQLQRAGMEAVINDIKDTTTSIVTLPLLGHFNGVVIMGIPDAVAFRESRPLYVMELKTTTGRPNIWPNNWLQAQLYAFLLDDMGFDCSDLNVVVASISQRSEIGRGPFLSELLDAIMNGKTDSFVKKWQCRIRLEPYSRHFVEDRIGWAMDYWLKKREPIPSDNPGKCRSCQQAESCPSNLLRSQNQIS
jgi:hypothetical protein